MAVDLFSIANSSPLTTGAAAGAAVRTEPNNLKVLGSSMSTTTLCIIIKG